MIELDGSYGEGGGQIVRTALALSILTQKAFHVTNIRKGRKDEGLKPQHLHCIKALQALCNAKAEGAELGSTELTFYPGPVQKRSLSVDIGTAGSISLFLQALLQPCFFTPKPVKLTITGGTNVAWSMPSEYLQEVLAPQLRKYCEKLSINILKRGYYPKGGGVLEISIKPKYTLEKLESAPCINLTEQNHLIHIKGISHASKHLENAKVAERQAQAARKMLGKYEVPINIRTEYANTYSPGSGITLWATFSKDKEEIDPVNPVIIGSDALGERGKPSEEIGKEAAQKLIKDIESKAPVDAHLADNLIPWMGLFKPSKIKAAELTKHATTNIYVVEKFLGKTFEIKEKIISSK